eukprot:g8779.t1
MGKSTVAAAVLQELYRQGVPAAFVVFEMPGELKRQDFNAGDRCEYVQLVVKQLRCGKLGLARRAMAGGTVLADDVQQSLDEHCAASGDACKKVVDFLADRVPVAKEDKLDYLCTSQALTCLSAHMDKCRSAHERVVQMQGEWQCEAVTCSQAGGDCSMTVLFLEMDDA